MRPAGGGRARPRGTLLLRRCREIGLADCEEESGIRQADRQCRADNVQSGPCLLRVLRVIGESYAIQYLDFGLIWLEKTEIENGIEKIPF